MTKKPYSECVFTIVKRSKLDQIFENGGDGSITEGRRWVTAQEMKKNAERAGKSMLVLFSDAAHVSHICYYAVIENIKVPLQGNKTTFTFTNLLPMPWPASASHLLKTDLLMLDGKPISALHIRPYTLCRTPEILLMSEDEIFASIQPVELDEGSDETDEMLDEAESEESSDEPFLEQSVIAPGTARITCYSLLQDVAYALPRSDSQKLADLRSTQTGEKAWDDAGMSIFQIMLEAEHQLGTTEAEMARCVTVGDIVALVKSKMN